MTRQAARYATLFAVKAADSSHQETGESMLVVTHHPPKLRVGACHDSDVREPERSAPEHVRTGSEGHCCLQGAPAEKGGGWWE